MVRLPISGRRVTRTPLRMPGAASQPATAAPAGGAAADGPVAGVGRAGHPVGVAEAVVEDLVGTGPAVAAAEVAAVVRAHDLGAVDAAVDDVVEERAAGPAVVRPQFGVRLLGAAVEEDVGAGGGAAGHVVVPPGPGVAAHDEHVGAVVDVERVAPPAGDLRLVVEGGAVLDGHVLGTTADEDRALEEVDRRDVANPGVLHVAEPDHPLGVCFVDVGGEARLGAQVLDPGLPDATGELVLVDRAAAELGLERFDHR